jgi:hypothetical protein
MNPTPEPTIYDIIAPQFVVFLDLSAVILSLLACAAALFIISKIWQRISKARPIDYLIAELSRSDYSSEHVVMLATRAVFVATGENIATMSGKELEEFLARYPKLESTVHFMAARFDPAGAGDGAKVVLELKTLLQLQRSK